MAETIQLTQHIEAFIDASRSTTQQAASLDAIASLVRKDVLTLETLVTEMEMYLTTTDNVIRARGILLLGELLRHLVSKPLDSATMHSLIGFFTERLADWRALRGALVGCLALMRRKNDAGMITITDAKEVAKSYLQNLQVQSLGQHDRKLCFELLECLLECYPDAIAALGDDLIYGICEAIDGEKDPQCLVLTFHIVELLAKLFSDPCGLLAGFAGDIFDVLSCYFPIHFTHPKGQEVDVTRNDLSRALMQAFSSTPIFEPFVIPLLLEKLSSSLPVAKVDSLKYLSDCTLKYGAERVAKHHVAIWSLIKDTICTFHTSVLSFAPESLNGVEFQENEIVTESLRLLHALVMQNPSFVSLIIADEDINTIFSSITSYQSYGEIPLQNKQKLHTVARILSVSIKASIASCNLVYQSSFTRLMDILGLSVRSSSDDCLPNYNCTISRRLNHGALCLCIELLAASRDLILGSEELVSKSVYGDEIWCSLLKSFSALLIEAFTFSIMVTNEDGDDGDKYLGVKGLQILGTFPGGCLLISNIMFERILMVLLSVVTENYNDELGWKLALKGLVNIGSSIRRSHESEKAQSYMSIVVEKVISLSSLTDDVPFPLKLEAVSDIGTSGVDYMLKIVKGLGEVLCAKISEVYVYGNLRSIEILVQLLKCFSSKVLPGMDNIIDSDDIFVQFAANIWNQVESCMDPKIQIHEEEVLDEAMMVMKLVVAACSVDSQNIIIQKAYAVLSSSTFDLKKSTTNMPICLDGPKINNMSSRDDWILSLFAAVVMAVSPQAHIPNVKSMLHMFLILLLKGHIPAAQALGSMLNKMILHTNTGDISSDCSLEEAVNIIFNTTLWIFHDNSSPSTSRGTDANEMDLTTLCYSFIKDRCLPVHVIIGLAWIGKGLLMRGHEKIKDMTMIFLECLLSGGEKSALLPSSEQDVCYSVMKTAADAFQIFMCDSEICLNQKFHAVIRPLYKQRFFSTMLPIMKSLVVKANSSLSRPMLYRAFAHIVTDTPLVVILNNARGLIQMMLDSLSNLSNDILHKDVLYSLLLILSAILTDKMGQEAATENAHIIINCLVALISYPHMMLVRETAIQCLVAMSGLPYTRIFPLRTQVIQGVVKALDDPKRIVRQEAVRCRQAWASTASRSLHS